MFVAHMNPTKIAFVMVSMWTKSFPQASSACRTSGHPHRLARTGEGQLSYGSKCPTLKHGSQ